jgi:hypothetical protein
MPEILLSLVMAAVMVWALVEVAQADRARVRMLPKAAWVVIVVLLAPFGPLAWFWLGRPHALVAARTTGGYPAVPLRSRRAGVSRPAPDDDPEFLAMLKARADQQRRLRRLEEDRSADPGADPDPERPPRD